MWLKAFLSPCSLHCCQPWCCSFPSASLSPSPQTSHPDRWAKRLHLRRETPPSHQQSTQRSLSHRSAPCSHSSNELPSDVSMRTSTSLKIPRRSSFCLAMWAFFITCNQDRNRAEEPSNNNYHASLLSTVSNTYIDEVFGVEDIRDLIAEQVLFSSSKTLDVDMLDDHLKTKIFYFPSHVDDNTF